MNLTRAQSLYIAMSTLVGFFVLSFLLMTTSSKQKTIPTAESVAREAVTRPTPAAGEANPQFELNDFHRSETRNGKKLWEVTAAHGEYIPEGNRAKLRAAKLLLYKKDGSIVELNAGQATLYLSGVSLSKAECYDGVTLLREGVTIETDQAVYNRAENTVSAPGFVKISSKLLDIRGNRLTGNIESQEFTLSEDVHSVVRARQNG